MKLPREVIGELRVEPGQKAGLSGRSTKGTRADWLGPLGHTDAKEVAEQDLDAFKLELEATQDLLYACDTYALLLVLQGLDGAGKDSTIKHVMSGVNPQGCDVHSFRQPSEEELRHDFLWRCARVLPQRGRIGIFNRSYYEEVLVVRVHPELLEAQHLPPDGPKGAGLWRQRFEDINAFEHHLVRSGTKVVKVFLHLSREEQRHRFLQRLDRPVKRWKFSSSDVAERAHFEEYQQAYEEALNATSTSWAPWYVVPADHKPALRALVGGIVVHELEQLDLAYPQVSGERAVELDQARQALEAETPAAPSGAGPGRGG